MKGSKQQTPFGDACQPCLDGTQSYKPFWDKARIRQEAEADPKFKDDALAAAESLRSPATRDFLSADVESDVRTGTRCSKFYWHLLVSEFQKLFGAEYPLNRWGYKK